VTAQAVLAASGQSVAGSIIAASATVIGVIVGGFLTGVVGHLRDRAREKRLAQTGARVVAADLAEASAALTIVSTTGDLIAEQVPAPPESWPAYREVLAARLPPEAWDQAWRAIAAVGRMARELPQLAPGGSLAHPSGATLKRIAAEVVTIDAGVRALTPEPGEARRRR
jgi:hypothetical protein